MRLDILITERKMVKSRSVALDLIKKGLVLVNGEIIDKPAKDIPDTEGAEAPEIKILELPKYVGRGGLKLEKALREFNIDANGLTCLDVGASTGGFTDCLLQNGAKKVYAIDVGTEQFDLRLREDPRIILREQTDIRNIEKLEERIDLAVIDVSFISLEQILDSVKNLVKDGGQIIALIKPQFETLKKAKNKSGVVKTKETREKVLENIKNYCQKIDLKILDITDSPILGGAGNKEYLILLKK